MGSAWHRLALLVPADAFTKISERLGGLAACHSPSGWERDVVLIKCQGSRKPSRDHIRPRPDHVTVASLRNDRRYGD